jgi:hypothetical protein
MVTTIPLLANPNLANRASQTGQADGQSNDRKYDHEENATLDCQTQRPRLTNLIERVRPTG